MDNKLSELSKPVGWTDAEELAELRGGTYANMFNGKHINAHDGQWEALYSQEYVSALLAALEAKSQCITGFERHVKDIETALIVATDEISDLTKERDEARAKLATPVRLKKVDSSNVPFAGDGFNAAVDYCSKAVRAAGFTVEGGLVDGNC